jgi:hypothetical protein
VLLRAVDQSAGLVVSPLGVPTWSQSRVPLGLPVETFEDGKLATPQRLEVHASVPTTPHLDWFSPGSFVELSDAEEMALPAFERHQAGVVMTLETTRSAGVPTEVSFQEIRLPSSTRVVGGLRVPVEVLDRLAAIAAPVSIRPRPARFQVLDDRFRVDGGPAAGVTAVAAHLATRGRPAAAQHVADRLVEVTV